MEEIRANLEEFLAEHTYELYRATAGLKEETQLAAIYDKYPALFHLDNLFAVAETLASTEDPEEKRKLRYLKEHLYLSFLDYRARELQEKALNLEASAVVDLAEGKV